MTLAARQYVGMALDYLEDACAAADQYWLLNTEEGKKLRKARRMVKRIHENDATGALDEDGEEDGKE